MWVEAGVKIRETELLCNSKLVLEKKESGISQLEADSFVSNMFCGCSPSLRFLLLCGMAADVIVIIFGISIWLSRVAEFWKPVKMLK